MANCVANPIYDTAFKFLMEDDRCAKILLSALLKKDVVDVKVRPHEYSKKEEKRVSIYRVDFCATIREGDGSEHLVLIELQKTWRPTELLRFRKYLGMQYEDKRNVNDETGVPLPVVSIYILGHKVGDLKEPVIYVKRQYLDYDSQEIKDGVPSVFVESLTHDSIIVQIPFLKGNVRNHLERILEIFNQDFVSDASHRLVYIEGRDFSDPDAQRLITRLAALRPEAILYISCSPATLARDLRLFAGHGYTADSVQPVDMFPCTGHVETVCLLTRENAAEASDNTV